MFDCDPGPRSRMGISRVGTPRCAQYFAAYSFAASKVCPSRWPSNSLSNGRLIAVADMGCCWGNGTDALRIGLAAVLDHDGLDYGGEVIVPNFSFIASATAAARSSLWRSIRRR